MLYQIHRYPAELIDVIRLEGGERVVIRPVLPQDEPLTIAFFGGLSAPTRYERFLTPMRHLPPELIKRFTNVDYANHLALVAIVVEDGEEIVVAEARYARLADPSEAEFAISVAEAWQGKRLAQVLLGKLACRASTAGVRKIVGETLATNEKMLHLARKAGFAVRRSPDVRGVMLLEKVVDEAVAGTACHAAAELAA
jgi:RimJ/RimL family protein N-acetyltransferase